MHERGCNKMAQWIKTLSTTADDLSLILKIHNVEGENRFP